MSAYERRTKNLLLSCKHKVEVYEPAPQLGEEQYCIRCGDYRAVDRYIDNFRVHCITRCTYARNFTTMDLADKYARKHTASHPKHKVEVKKNGEKVKEYTNVEEALFSTHSEMAALSRNAQQLLRDAFGAEVIETREV